MTTVIGRRNGKLLPKLSLSATMHSTVPHVNALKSTEQLLSAFPSNRHFSDAANESLLSSPYTNGPAVILDGEAQLLLGCEGCAAFAQSVSTVSQDSAKRIRCIINVAKEVQYGIATPEEEYTANTATDTGNFKSIPPGGNLPRNDEPFRFNFKSCASTPESQDNEVVPTIIADINTKRDSPFNDVKSMRQRDVPIEYFKFAWSHNQDLTHHLDKAISAIQAARAQGKTVLVHCQQGVSRSAALVIAYIMKTERKSFHEAYAFVKMQSPCISPNMSLVSQLVVFEKEWNIVG